MRRIVKDAMKDGAFGMASALIYPPDNFVSTADLIDTGEVLPRTAAYTSPTCGPRETLLEAIDEAIAIGTTRAFRWRSTT